MKELSMFSLSGSLRMLHAPSFRVVALAAVGAMCVSLPLSPLSAQRDRDQDRGSRRENAFTWSGNIPNGRRILIKNINGGIDVERSNSGRVEVTAEKRWRRGDPEDVRIEQ